MDLKGSYKCLCLDGYFLDGDMKTCRASGMFYVGYDNGVALSVGKSRAASGNM